MDTQKNFIVFLCYGNERVFHECAFSLLSLSRLDVQTELANTEIWIYTDNAAWFRLLKDCPLPLFFRELDKATISRWRGNIDFVHRIKVETLLDFTIGRQGNILYLDTDTVFTHPINKMFGQISNGILYMHTMEGVVRESLNPIFKKLNRYLNAGAAKKINNKPLSEMAMWNAGVLGFNTKYRDLLNEVLAFTDSEYPAFPKHIVEQFAFSVYFQQAGHVKAASPYIFHYWKLKEAGYTLASFFDYFNGKTWEELVHYSSLVQMHALMQEKVDFYHNRNIAGSLTGKKWLPMKKDWAELVKHL